MKLHLPRRRVWRVAIYLGALLLVLIASDLVLVQIRRTIHPGYDTTRIVAPLQPDGSIDYLVAIETYFSRGVTSENNAAPIVLQALGRRALASNQPTDGITDRLGMPHLPEKGDYFVDRKEQGAEIAPDYLNMRSRLTWPLKVDAVTAQWIKDNEKPLTLMTEATKRPRFFMPYYGGYRTELLPEIMLPYLALLNDVGRALRIRGLMRLESGDVAGFRADMLTMHRLARLIGQQPTMIDRLVAIAIENAACEATRTGIVSGKVPAEQLKAMAAELAAMGDLPAMSESVDISERYMVLDTLQVMAKSGPMRAGQVINMISNGPQLRFGPKQMFAFMPIKFEELMRAVNAYNDGALAAMHQPTYPQRAAALSQWQQHVKPAKVEELSTLDLLSSTWPAQLFAPALLRAQVAVDTTRMQSRLTQVALALAAFKADHSAYPATLAELAPTYLAMIPNDIFSEKPLIYSKSADGYTFYGVGPNMIDDGGKSDDLVASMP